MYEMKGYIFINGSPKPLNKNIFVKSWEEAHEMCKKAQVQHYLITLIKKGDN